MPTDVTIEPLTPADFAVVAEWLSNPDVNQWLTSEWRGRAVDATLLGITSRNRRNKLFLVRVQGQPAGLVALADIDTADRIAMIWYVLGNLETGGRGVISEAVGQLVTLAFETMDIDAIHAWIVDDNLRSRRVLEKNGFAEVGRLRRAALHDGRRQDRVYFDILRP